jgi:hypothetical protein
MFKFNSPYVLALFAAFLSFQTDVSQACQNPINPSMNPTRLKTEIFDRDIYIVGCADSIPEKGLPILFGFHGGGESVVSEKKKWVFEFHKFV